MGEGVLRDLGRMEEESIFKSKKEGISTWEENGFNKASYQQYYVCKGTQCIGENAFLTFGNNDVIIKKCVEKKECVNGESVVSAVQWHGQH